MAGVVTLLGRGLAAGGVAGLVSGAFGILVAEPLMDRAVNMEVPDHAHGGEHVEVFTRETQHLGLVIAAVLAGLAIGVFFALAYAVVHRHDIDGDPWGRSLRLAGAAFVGVWLLPFLRYPANPPGVGDAGTVDFRTYSWLVAIAVGVAAVLTAWRLHVYLAGRGTLVPARQLAVVAIPVAALLVLYLLPENADPVEVPATLLWDFRLLSLATAALLWGTLGVCFGLLGLRSRTRREPVPSARPGQQ